MFESEPAGGLPNGVVVTSGRRSGGAEPRRPQRRRQWGDRSGAPAAGSGCPGVGSATCCGGGPQGVGGGFASTPARGARSSVSLARTRPHGRICDGRRRGRRPRRQRRLDGSAVAPCSEWPAKGEAKSLGNASRPLVGGTVPWWHYSPRGTMVVRRPSPLLHEVWHCGGAYLTATVAGGGFRLLLVHAAAGTRQQRGGVDRLVGLVRCREVGTTTVRRSYNGGRWCAASGTSPRRKWLQEWCWLPAANGGSGVRGSGRKPLPDSFWWIGGGTLGCCSPCSGRHFGAITLPLEVYG
jgi:hypothetical protein